MATNSLHCLHHTVLHHRHPSDTPTTTSPSTVFLKPSTTTTTTTLSITTATATKNLSITAAAVSAATSAAATLDTLQTHLAAQDFRQADEETRSLLIKLAGEAAQNRGYVFFSEVQFIPEEDLKAIDELWKEHSNGKFGYSVQKKIWKKVNEDFSSFFVKVGWMKKLDTEIDQYNYKAFPNEFFWENNDETPVGHLPLTNALRGTQLLTCILSHPAFASGQGDSDGEEEDETENRRILGSSRPLTNNRVLKSDYSF